MKLKYKGFLIEVYKNEQGAYDYEIYDPEGDQFSQEYGFPTEESAVDHCSKVYFPNRALQEVK